MTRSTSTTSSTRSSTRAAGIRSRRLAVTAAAALAAAALAVTPALSSSAAPEAMWAAPGWIRLAHLSPDTKTVDVRLTALGGGSTLYELDGVAYGAVSPYTAMPDGTYTVTMVPAGAAPDSPPVVSTSVRVTQGRASTVAAYGDNADLEVGVFDDDLTTPAAGAARVRLIQASTTANVVDVATTTGLTIADGARSGTAIGYAEVPAGPWSLELTGKRVDGSAAVDLAPGSVTTLLVLDTADGDLTISPVLDSAAVGQAPVGSVAAGGGWLAAGATDGGGLASARTAAVLR